MAALRAGGGQQGGLDLVAPDVGKPDGPLGVFLGGCFVLGVKAEGLEQIDAVNRITQPGVPVDGFHKAPRGGRGGHVVAHTLGLHFRTSETGIVAHTSMSMDISIASFPGEVEFSD